MKNYDTKYEEIDWGNLPVWSDPYFDWDIDKPPYTPADNIICRHCKKDSGIAKILHMVIPEDGLSCQHCGKVIVHPVIVRC